MAAITTATTPLKKLRKARGLSQTDVAKAVGIDQATLSRIEGGTYGPRKDAYLALAKYFGSAISLEQIIFPERFEDYEVAEK